MLPRKRSPRTLTAGRLVSIRLRSGWHSYLPLWFGFVVAVALVTAFPEAARLADGAGLRATVAGLGGGALVVVGRTAQLDADGYRTLREAYTRDARTGLRDYLLPVSARVTSRTYDVSSKNGKPDVHGREPGGDVLTLASYNAFDRHAQLVAGSWPADNLVGGDYPVSLSRAAAAQLGVSPGDELCMNNSLKADAFCVRVSGVWQARDPTEPYWGGDPIAPLVAELPEDLLFKVVSGPGMSESQVTMVFAPDLEAIGAADPGDVGNRLSSLRPALGEAQGTNVTTQLDEAVKAYQMRMQAAGFALQLVSAQLWLLALFCAAFLVRLRLDQDRQAISVWRSRGGSRAGIGAALALELLAVALAALPVGAAAGWMAGWAGTRLAYPDLPPPHPAAGGTGALWVPLAAAAAIGVAVVLAQVALATRGGVLRTHMQASRPDRPWWRRPVAGVVALALAVPMLAEAQVLGSARLREAGGAELPYDLVLPGLALGLIAFAGVRLLPAAGRAAERAARSVEQRLASLQLRRSPARQEDLALLLAATVAVGVFASAYAATSARDAGDRAGYAAGADVRAVSRAERPVDLQSLPVDGLAARSPVFRSYARAGSSTVESPLLGVDPWTFGGVAWSRPDLFPTPIPGLMRELAAKEQGGVLLPGSASGLSIQVDGASTGGRLVANLTDADDQPVTADFGDLGFSGWRRLVAGFAPAARPPRPPLRLRSLTFTPVTREGTVAVAQLAAMGPDGSQVAKLQDFSYDASHLAGPFTSPWWQSDGDTGFRLQDVFPTQDRPLAGLRTASVFLKPGYLPVSLTPSYQYLPTVRRFSQTSYPVPALVSPSVLRKHRLNVGDRLELRVDSAAVPALIVGVVSYFPTLYPVGQDIIVMSEVSLLAELGEAGHQRPWPDELWGRALPGQAGRAAAQLRAHTEVVAVYSAAELRRAAASDPLLLGGRVNLAIGFAAALGLAVAGFAIHFLVVARGRATEYAILRAHGMSSAQVRRSLGVEQALLLAFSGALGLVVGGLTAAVLLPSLQVASSPRDVVPPTVVSVDWAPLALALLGVLAACLLAGRLGARTAARSGLMAELRSLG